MLAHEWGHAVQARVGFETYQTVYLEQQADCFAGAWARTSPRATRRLAVGDDLDTALAGLLQLSDPSGVDGSQDGAHGNGFDRVGAFQDGVEGGAADVCGVPERTRRRDRVGLHQPGRLRDGRRHGLGDLLPAVTDA